ncbi:unnamed protein product [Closterium sp. NIES-65]|nr:unnamed protein product [Closterium sp. NIES-65]
MADLRSSRDDEGEERGGWAHEDKARGEQGRAREWEEAERQSREVKLGLHPLQVRFRIVTVSKYFGQETAFAELHRVNRVLALSTSIRPPLHPRCKQTRYVVWYTRRQRQPPGQRSATSYEDSIRRIADFSTVEGFWGCYCRMVRPSALPAPTDVHVFKDGIRPLWEVSAPPLPSFHRSECIPSSLRCPPPRTCTSSKTASARSGRRHPPALGGERPSSPLFPPLRVYPLFTALPAPTDVHVFKDGIRPLWEMRQPALRIPSSTSAPSSRMQQPVAYPLSSPSVRPPPLSLFPLPPSVIHTSPPPNPRAPL